MNVIEEIYKFARAIYQSESQDTNIIFPRVIDVPLSLFLHSNLSDFAEFKKSLMNAENDSQIITAGNVLLTHLKDKFTFYKEFGAKIEDKWNGFFLSPRQDGYAQIRHHYIKDSQSGRTVILPPYTANKNEHHTEEHHIKMINGWIETIQQMELTDISSLKQTFEKMTPPKPNMLEAVDKKPPAPKKPNLDEILSKELASHKKANKCFAALIYFYDVHLNLKSSEKKEDLSELEKEMNDFAPKIACLFIELLEGTKTHFDSFQFGREGLTLKRKTKTFLISFDGIPKSTNILQFLKWVLSLSNPTDQLKLIIETQLTIFKNKNADLNELLNDVGNTKADLSRFFRQLSDVLVMLTDNGTVIPDLFYDIESFPHLKKFWLEFSQDSLQKFLQHHWKNRKGNKPTVSKIFSALNYDKKEHRDAVQSWFLHCSQDMDYEMIVSTMSLAFISSLLENSKNKDFLNLVKDNPETKLIAESIIWEDVSKNASQPSRSRKKKKKNTSKKARHHNISTLEFKSFFEKIISDLTVTKTTDYRRSRKKEGNWLDDQLHTAWNSEEPYIIPISKYLNALKWNKVSPINFSHFEGDAKIFCTFLSVFELIPRKLTFFMPETQRSVDLDPIFDVDDPKSFILNFIADKRLLSVLIDIAIHFFDHPQIGEELHKKVYNFLLKVLEKNDRRAEIFFKSKFDFNKTTSSVFKKTITEVRNSFKLAPPNTTQLMSSGPILNAYLLITREKADLSIVRKLLTLGAHVNGRSRNHCRVSTHSSDVDAFIESDHTPLSLAIAIPNADLVQLFINWGADLSHLIRKQPIRDSVPTEYKTVNLIEFALGELTLCEEPNKTSQLKRIVTQLLEKKSWSIEQLHSETVFPTATESRIEKTPKIDTTRNWFREFSKPVFDGTLTVEELYLQTLYSKTHFCIYFRESLALLSIIQNRPDILRETAEYFDLNLDALYLIPELGNEYSGSLLHFAIKQKQVACINMLTDLNANWEIRDSDGKTSTSVFDLAFEKEIPEPTPGFSSSMETDLTGKELLGKIRNPSDQNTETVTHGLFKKSKDSMNSDQMEVTVGKKPI